MNDDPPETLPHFVDPERVTVTAKGRAKLAELHGIQTEEWIDRASQERYRRIAGVLDPMARHPRHADYPDREVAQAAGDCNAAQADEIARLRYWLHLVCATSKAVDHADATAHDPDEFDDAVRAHQDARLHALAMLGEVSHLAPYLTPADSRRRGPIASTAQLVALAQTFEDRAMQQAPEPPAVLAWEEAAAFVRRILGEPSKLPAAHEPKVDWSEQPKRMIEKRELWGEGGEHGEA